MEHYIGLDVSLKLTAICIVDQTGKIEREGVVSSDPEAIAAFIKLHAPHVARVGLAELQGLHALPRCWVLLLPAHWIGVLRDAAVRTPYRKSPVAHDCVVGLEGLEPPTRPL
jgi:hypothetical protein